MHLQSQTLKKEYQTNAYYTVVTVKSFLYIFFT